MAFVNSLPDRKVGFERNFSPISWVESDKMRSSTKMGAALLVLLAAVWFRPELPAQEARPAPQNPRPAASDRPKPANAEAERLRLILGELSEEERQRFRSAVNEIWHADEVEKRRLAMQEANLAYRKALQDEIRRLEVSPKLRGVLLKLLQSRFRQDGMRVGDPRASDRPNGSVESDRPYSQEERAILDQARQKAEKTPEAVAAKLKVARAVTSREKALASGEYRRVMMRAMEAADPRVKRIFAAHRRSLDRRTSPDGGGEKPRNRSPRLNAGGKD